VKRTRYAHEVSLASLFILRNEAYSAGTEDRSESFESWVSRQCKESVQFLYWQTTLELESLLLNFVRSIRVSNFNLFVQMLKEICPWFFALDLTHYSRWLPVFIKPLEELPLRHPQVYTMTFKRDISQAEKPVPLCLLLLVIICMCRTTG